MIKTLRGMLAVLLCLSQQVLAQEHNIVVTNGADRAIPIAVVPFGGQGGQEDIASIIGADLHNSGIFEPIPRENMISQPTQPSEVNFRDWKALGVQYLLIGDLAPAGSGVEAHYSLFNVNTEQQLAAGQAGGSRAQLRDLAHYVSDQAFEHLTGTKGAFATHILYVTAQQSGPGNIQYTLHRSDYDGARAVTLLRSREPILSPTYSPNGKQIAYVSFEQRKPRIFLQNMGTGGRRQLTNYPGLNNAPAFSPDGSRLALTLSKDGNPEIYILSLASGALTRVTNDPSIDTEPYWGKDGRTLYFTSDRSGKPQIYKQAVGGGAQRVTFNGNYNASPKLSADEKTLVMVHRQQGYTNFTVAAMDLQRGSLRVLGNSGSDESPTVAPNGGMLIYATHQRGRGELMLVSSNGRVRLPLPTAPGDIRMASWSPFLN